MANISNSFYRDYTAAKNDKRNAAKPITVVRLTKNGKQSKLAGDTLFFTTIEEAHEYIARIGRLNPGKNYRFQIIRNSTVA